MKLFENIAAIIVALAIFAGGLYVGYKVGYMVSYIKSKVPARLLPNPPAPPSPFNPTPTPPKPEPNPNGEVDPLNPPNPLNFDPVNE